MSSMKNQLIALMTLGAMFEQPGWAEGRGTNSYFPPKGMPEKPIPKGCKEYFFNESGEFSNDRMRKTECVFICIASNDKNAIKKFNKWKEENK